MKRTIAILLMAAMLLGLLAGCGSKETPVSTSGNAAEPVETKAPVLDATVPEDTVSGVVDVVNIASDRDPTSLAPWAGNMGGASAIICIVYQTLQICEVNETEGDPCLAKSVTKVDELTYDVELFDYITDSLGNPFTAKDVEFCVKQAKAEGKVASTKVVDSVDVTGDYTFTVHFSKTAAMGDFEGFFNQLYFVTQAAYEASPDGMATTPVGTAAYVMSDYVGGSHITFDVRKDYWQTDDQYIARSSEAHADQINYLIVTEASQRAIAAESGTLDYGAISYTDLERVQANENLHIVEVPDNLTYLLFPNCDDSAVTSNQALREAVFYALDNVGLAAAYSSGKAVPVYDLSNSNYADYYEAEYVASAENNYYKYDPEMAKEKLAEAGYPDGLTLRICCSSDQGSTEVTEIMKAYLNQVGIDLEITALQGNLMSSYTEDPTAWDLYLVQYASTDYAVNVWEKVLNQAKYSWGGTINFIMEQELQDKLAECRTQDGHTKENVVAFHDYIVENAYGIGLIQGIQYFAVNNKIQDVIFSDQRLIRPNACIYAAE